MKPNAKAETYWPREKSLYFMFGRRAELAFSRVRRAWGVQWRGGFIGVLLTETKEGK
jgi:hypothetical protein